jgi:endo-1,4-beta-xylanase
MKTIRHLLFLTAVFLFFNNCKEESSKDGAATTATEEATLKNAFKENFYIGAALNAAQINGEDAQATALLLKEFNSITPENRMKWMHIHPGRDSFDFLIPDKYVALGESNNMFIVGHTLVWHSQLAPWVNEVKDAAEMEAVLTNHINTIVGKYKGRVNGWDVLNEALNEDGTLRESIFLKTMGEGYIKKAFDLAAAADPEAELYYNDYNLSQPKKLQGCIEMIKKLQASGTKIDGVGIQGHWSINGPSVEQIEAAILAYHELGLKVHFTEVDITVLPNPWDLKGAEVDQNFEGSPFMNPYPDALPDSVQVNLAQRYQDIFKVLLKHQDKIERVTFWGLNDGQSWLNGWPIKNRTNYPLLFDREFKPKKAYDSVMELKKKEKP